MTQFITWPYVLRKGHSDNPAEGACAMDAVNWLVHGKHGDAPECACPLIARFVIGGNDAMPDDVRQRLLTYLPRIAGSRSEEHEAARLRVLVLSAVRVFASRALGAAGLTEPAAHLRTLPDDASYSGLRDAADAAMWAADAATGVADAAARAAADAAARAAADAMAWAAVDATARAATAWAARAATAWAADAAARAAGAARAARTAERAATWAAARAAARAATWSATWDDYFLVLDAVLAAGPQGEPWGADAIERGTTAYTKAGGLLIPA